MGKHSDTRTYAFLMIDYEMPDFIKDLQNKLDDEELFVKKEDDSYGKESECHVTVVPCLNNDVDLKELKRELEDISKYDVVLTDVSKFENEEFDVLKCSAKSMNLFDTNKRIKEKFETHSEFGDDYKPHMTIAYMRHGMADKYLLNTLPKLIVVKPICFHFSYYDKDNKKKDVKF